MTTILSLNTILDAAAKHGVEHYQRRFGSHRDGIGITGRYVQVKRVALELGLDVCKSSVDNHDDVNGDECVGHIVRDGDCGVLVFVRQAVAEHRLHGDFT